MKFPKSVAGLTPQQRLAVSGVLHRAGCGQNHLTRLVRGVLLALAAEMAGGKIKLQLDKNHMEWRAYDPETVTSLYSDVNQSPIWCEYPRRNRYASILPHFCCSWNSTGLPARILALQIPADANMIVVVGLATGTLTDVEVDAQEIRSALATYAQSMACEEIMEQAYCIASIMLLHEHWPSLSLPATIAASDLVRPAMSTRHYIMEHKRDWNLREAKIVSKYSLDALGLCMKELMSSCWDYKSENLSQVLSNLGNGPMMRRNAIYKWLSENIIGRDSAFLFILDPLFRGSQDRVRVFNETSTLAYWWVNEAQQVGNGSVIGLMMSSVFTTMPSSDIDTASAQELGLLRQIEVIKNGPLYKKEVRLKKPVIDSEKKKLFEANIKEGRVSICVGGLSVSRSGTLR